MKTKLFTLLLAAMTLFTVLSAGSKVTAQEIVSQNLFKNPGWEEGYFNQDQIAQIAVPNSWRMHWLDGQAFEGTNGLPAYRPETVVWNIKDAPENERSMFFRDGSYTFKIFKSWAPLYAALSQEVTGLEVGRKYRISAPIFVDIIEDYQGGKKIPPADPRQGFVRFGAGPVGSAWLNGSQINYSPYWTAENVNPFYQTMPIFIWDFVATQANMTIFIEMGSKYPFRNNGFFMDGVGLYALNETTGVTNPNPGTGGGSGGGSSAPIAAPTLPPVEVTPREDGSIVHLVTANDSFWTIAIRYAPVLEMPAEQALPYIQEINGNPAFVITGQELLIREPGNYVDASVGGEETAVSETPAAEATPAAETGTGEEGRDETGTEVIVVEGVDAAATPEAPAEEAPQPQAPAGVCVSAFDDANGNGQFDSSTERLKSDAAITLFKDGQTISTYITDGVSNDHCFQDLAPGTYQVQLYPPANYVPTTADSWAISVSGGVLIPLQFGMQFQETQITQVAAVDTSLNTADNSADTAVAPESPAATDKASAATVEGGGLFSNLGVIVIMVAVVLILLAGAGVVMLRRG